MAKQRPPSQGMYIIYAASADPDRDLIVTAWWHDEAGGRWDLLPKCWAHAVSYWMLLPEPPK